jgi:hypothetical protein
MLFYYYMFWASISVCIVSMICLAVCLYKFRVFKKSLGLKLLKAKLGFYFNEIKNPVKW